MGLQLVTPAAGEPVSLADISAQVRVASTADSARLTRMVAAAREWCEAYLGQQFLPATYKWTIDRFINLYLFQTSLWTQQIWPWHFQSQSLIGNRLPNTWYMLFPPRGPLKSVTSIKYYDLRGVQQTLDPAAYLVDTTDKQPRISPAFGLYWPPTQMRIDAVEIVFVAGYDQVPSSICLAIEQLAAHWYDQREAVTFDQAQEVPMGVKSLLDSHATGRYICL